MTSPQPGWYADPAGVADLRWWDGGRWSDAVLQRGVQDASPLPPHRPVPTQVLSALGRPALFTEPVLVVERAEPAGVYTVSDASGRAIGSAGEVAEAGLGRAGRWPGVGRFLTHRLEVRDVRGVPQLLIVRLGRLAGRKVVVERPGAGQIGQLVQEDVVGFRLVSGGQPVGSLVADRGAGDVAALDHAGVEVARIRRTFEGVTTTLPTTGDAYVVRISQPLPDPLLSLVLAGALTVGPALGQRSL